MKMEVLKLKLVWITQYTLNHIITRYLISTTVLLSIVLSFIERENPQNNLGVLPINSTWTIVYTHHGTAPGYGSHAMQEAAGKCGGDEHRTACMAHWTDLRSYAAMSWMNGQPAPVMLENRSVTSQHEHSLWLS